MHRLAFLPCLFLLLALGGCRQEQQDCYPIDRLTVEHTFSHQAMLVGDPVELVVTATYPTNGLLELPELGRKKEVVLIECRRTQVERSDALAQTAVRCRFTSFKPGLHIITTNAIICTLGETRMSSPFPDVKLNVKSSLSPDASGDIADIQPPRPLPARIPGWVQAVCGAAISAYLIGLLTVRLWKRRARTEPAPMAVPPHLIALRALETLKARSLLEEGDCDPFYTELSLILRTYLEARFNLNAPEETTEEIIAGLAQSPELSGTQRNILQDFMRKADLVKFAKGRPGKAAMESAFTTTRRFVEETTMAALEPLVS